MEEGGERLVDDHRGHRREDHDRYLAHLRGIYRKPGVSQRRDAVVVARQRGLVRTPVVDPHTERATPGSLDHQPGRRALAVNRLGGVQVRWRGVRRPVTTMWISRS